MAEPDQIEFHERVTVSGKRPGDRSLPGRIGIVAGSALLVVIGAAAAMGASPGSPAAGAPAALSAAAAPEAGTFDAPPLGGGFPGGFGRGGPFFDITISAVNGSTLSLKTDDGWTRTITVASSTTITKAGKTIAVGDLAVGDQILLGQKKGSDGTYTITTIRVVLPVVAGKVTAINGNTITVAGKGTATGTIHVDGSTTYDVNGTAGTALSDITVGTIVVAEGTKRSDGSLDADTIHAGFRGLDGKGGPGFRDHDKPKADPAATPATNAS